MINVFAGLGNYGSEYSGTRHNAGFLWVDELAKRLNITFALEKGFHSLIAKTQYQGRTIWLLKPQTYMNRSGLAVGALARFYKIPAEQIMVIHDELDLIPGQAKLKLGGGPAGHNGLKDIDAQLGTRAYWRLRLGIGHPGVRSEVINWVLKRPALEHQRALEESVERTLDYVSDLLDGHFETAAQHINAKPPKG